MSDLMRILTASLLTAATLATAADTGWQLNLTVEERLGIPRAAEPVTSGIPLPRGAFKDSDGFRLFDAEGQPLPAQFGVATRWWDDGSIKWLHVDFQAGVSGGNAEHYVLRHRPDAPEPEPAADMTITPSGDGFAVDTGPLRFSVKGQGFNGFDTLAVHGIPLLTSGHEGGFRIRTADGVFSPHACPEARVVIEEQGPMKVVLLATGRHVGPDGSGYALDYKCRFYAYAGSTRVKVVYTVENRRGKWTDHIAVSDWVLELPLALEGTPRFTLGPGKDAPLTGALSAPLRAEVLATDLYRIQGPGIEQQGHPKAEAPPWLGMLDLSGNKAGLTLGLRHFWQTWAKTLEATPDGRLTLRFWTDRVRDKGETTLVDAEGRAQFFAGMAWTHEFWINLHDGKAAQPLAAMAPVREPLFARCPPAWYCWGTRVFGHLSEADPEVYRPAWRDRVQALNTWAEQCVKRPLARWHAARSGKVDSFGLFSYGDGVEQIKGTKPSDIHWEGGYYDYPHSVFLNFARTGDLFYLWLGHDMSRHNADIHHTHHDRHPGHSRYCPSREHIRADRSGRPANASPTFNHWKNLSAFERWYLTGDHRGLEAGLEISRWAMRLGNDGISFGQPRSICHGILGFWAAYEATGEQVYADALKRYAREVAQAIESGKKMRSGSWQRGMAIQGLCWYAEQTGDNSVVPAIRIALERDADAKADELAYGNAFMWRHTGEPRYFAAATHYLKGGRAEKWMQRFGNKGRSRLYTPALVRKDAVRQPPAE